MKTPSKYNKNFIGDCLKTAVKQLKTEMGDDSPDFYIDRDTKDVSGLPNIPTTIERKIRFCDVFVGDNSYVAYTNTNQPQAKRSIADRVFGRNKWIKEGVYSTNVAEESGIAIGSERGSERIVTVMNTAYGTPAQLNFDSLQKRYPLTYFYNSETSKEKLKIEMNSLITGLKERIKLILETEHERQKDYFFPLITWKIWAQLIDRPFPFEPTEYIKKTLITIKSNINIPKAIYRFCGLSGIGKTRMLFECFTDLDSSNPEISANKLLYADINEQDEKEIIKSVKELLLRDENKILILDNCPKELHNRVTKLITNENSKLSALTISTDPEEKANELDSEGHTQLIILDNQLCKETVSKILINNFNFQEEEQKLLVEFSSGVAFVATLMAQNLERGAQQPGTLTQKDLVRRLLGSFFEDENSRAVVYACSLFSKFGFFDDLEYQVNAIALNDDIFKVDTSNINVEDRDEWKKMKFKETCLVLQKRQLLEKKGRTFCFRPSPLAVKMAEEWWSDCTMSKFERFLPTLTKANLVEGFCEQFRYLRHVENAKTIVKNLCDGFFSLAEVLNTKVGSRLFRSFVYVNPIACSNALSKAFIDLPKNELIELKEGRRNLVWALEQLCFRPETFQGSAKVLAAFAISENENIGNNSTGQFFQLFHIFLPCTSANLNERLIIIKYCLTKNEDYQLLGLNAISRGLSLGHFSRMGRAEVQGDSAPLQDYNPSGKEIFEYWKECISLLEKMISKDNPLIKRAVSIINETLYGLCMENAGKLILPAFENLLKAGLLNKLETRKKIQFILSSDKLFDPYSLQELKRLFAELAPTNFAETFNVIVQSPSSEEYLNNEGIHDFSRENLYNKIEKLCDHFLQFEEKWEEYTNYFVVGPIAEGSNFGKCLAKKVDKPLAEKIISLLIKKLKITPPEKRNLSVFLGFLNNYNDRNFTPDIFNQIIFDADLNYVAFVIARSFELPLEYILLLIKETENGNFSSNHFSEFNYGWGIRHLPVENAIEILEKIRLLDETGKAIAFFIFATWIGDKKETFLPFRAFIRKIIFEDSTIIFTHLRNSMDIHYYEVVLIKFLTENNDEEIASFSISFIIEQSKKFEQFFNKENTFFRILDILQERYFSILWKALSEMYLDIEKFGMAVFQLKSLLGSRHDYHNQSEGLLFKGNAEKFEIIFEWCKEHTGDKRHWIAELLPLFEKERSFDNDWHPYAKKFINEFYLDKNVLSAIGAKLGSYSWTGTIVTKLKSDKALFEYLLDSPESEIKEWAEINIDDIEKRIKWEKDRDEEEFSFA